MVEAAGIAAVVEAMVANLLLQTKAPMLQMHKFAKMRKIRKVHCKHLRRWGLVLKLLRQTSRR